MIYPVDSAIQCLIKRAQLSMRVIFFCFSRTYSGACEGEGGIWERREGVLHFFLRLSWWKVSLVNTLESRLRQTRKLRNSQIENEHIKTAQTVFLYKTGVNLLISVNDLGHVVRIHVCRKRD